jgi:GntR family transcriptional regulator, transcriptional repressor for pyruvate dehydrogenase complex
VTSLDLRRVDQNRSIVSQIVEQFKESLINGQLRPGDQIPPEPVLCERLGVSRTSVREAIRTLVAVGLVEIRRGNGTYISASSLAAPAELLGLALALAPTRTEHLFGMRLAIEHACGRLAIEHATVADIAAMEAQTDEFEELVRTGRPARELRNADLAFHGLLFDATHNPVFCELGKALMTAFASTMQQALHDPEVDARAPGDHREIIDAIRQRSTADYDQVVERSLSRWRQFLDPKTPNHPKKKPKEKPL